MKADLHIHSKISDGSDGIAQIIGSAKEKGLDAIAIVEHDTVSHMTQIPADADIMIVTGIEISATDRETNTRVHILGYNIQKPEIVAALTNPTLVARNRNSMKQADILIRHGFWIDIDKLERADGKYIYKQHIMDWLVTTGQVHDMFGEFYHKTFKNGGICAFDIEYIDYFDAVRAIKEAGGLAVLAHPGQQQSFWLIPKLVRLGLDGLELNHHTHTEKDRATIRNRAWLHGLFLTGGSDYHGKYEPQPYGIGDFLSDESGVEAIVGVAVRRLH